MKDSLDVERSFEQLYDEYAKGIFRFTYFKISNHELAEDITAETFLRFWKTASAGKTIENERAFLYFIARGLIIDHFRDKKHKALVPIEKVEDWLVSTEDNIEGRIDVRDQINTMIVRLEQIKKEYKDVLLLYYVEEFNVSEIASMLKKKSNAVRVLIHRALKALKTIS